MTGDREPCPDCIGAGGWLADDGTWFQCPRCSQAAGYTRRKVGQVVAVVPAKTGAWAVADGLKVSRPELAAKVGRFIRRAPGMCREHKSYLVLARPEADRSPEALYWPQVKKLHKVEPKEVR